MDFEIPWRRIATGAVVLLLHALFLYILAISMHGFPSTPAIVREIVLNLMPPNGQHTLQQDLHIPTPKLIRPEQSEPNAITVLPALNKELQQPPGLIPGDMGGIGRYLYNCSGMFYEQLPARERAGCLLNKWDVKPSSPLLGIEKPSQFDPVIAKRQAPPRPIEKPCDQTSINANLGLPCFSFSQH